MRGPPPKPTKLKLLRGEKNKDRINENEPQPATGKLDCPKHLGEEAKRYWEGEAPKLQRLGLLTEIDIGPFELLCEAYGNWIEYKKLLKEGGLTEVGVAK